VSYQIEDEDVQLIAEALKAAGWSRATNKPGFSAKMLELQKLDKKLKDILTALIEAKVTELPTMKKAIEPLNEKDAIELFTKAVIDLGIDHDVHSEAVTKDVHSLEYGAGQIVTGHHLMVYLKNMQKYDIHALVNYIRQTGKGS
jgi:hypothetical protein